MAGWRRRALRGRAFGYGTCVGRGRRCCSIVVRANLELLPSGHRNAPSAGGMEEGGVRSSRYGRAENVTPSPRGRNRGVWSCAVAARQWRTSPLSARRESRGWSPALSPRDSGERHPSPRPESRGCGPALSPRDSGERHPPVRLENAHEPGRDVRKQSLCATRERHPLALAGNRGRTGVACGRIVARKQSAHPSRERETVDEPGGDVRRYRYAQPENVTPLAPAGSRARTGGGVRRYRWAQPEHTRPPRAGNRARTGG
jgi:hypothetical protein